MSHPPAAGGRRIAWSELPDAVRDWVHTVLGGPVVAATSQPRGFSPGSADRVVTAQGRRAFVKAVSSKLNARSPELHRREAVITALLPATVPAPRLLASYDDGIWVGLVFDEVAGTPPATPWRADQLEAVTAALESLATVDVRGRLRGELGSAQDLLRADFSGWANVAADPPVDLDPWAKANLRHLVALAEEGLTALAGERLCHADVRADNLLLRPDGKAVLVDWPWACLGPGWLDTLLLALNVELFGGHDTDALLRRAPTTATADPALLTAVLAGLAGYFLDVARQPPAPGVPNVRAFQRAQADVVLRWLRRRLEPSAGPDGPS